MGLDLRGWHPSVVPLSTSALPSRPRQRPSHLPASSTAMLRSADPASSSSPLRRWRVLTHGHGGRPAVPRGTAAPGCVTAPPTAASASSVASQPTLRERRSLPHASCVPRRRCTLPHTSGVVQQRRITLHTEGVVPAADEVADSSVPHPHPALLAAV
jgi:hypothetical protein